MASQAPKLPRCPIRCGFSRRRPGAGQRSIEVAQREGERAGLHVTVAHKKRESLVGQRLPGNLGIHATAIVTGWLPAPRLARATPVSRHTHCYLVSSEEYRGDAMLRAKMAWHWAEYCN